MCIYIFICIYMYEYVFIHTCIYTVGDVHGPRYIYRVELLRMAVASASLDAVRAARHSPKHKLFKESFCKSSFPHKSNNLSFILEIIKDKFTDLCGDRLLQKYLINTFCEVCYCYFTGWSCSAWQSPLRVLTNVFIEYF